MKKDTDSRPYFQVEGQAISDTGGDFHCVVFTCKADGDLEGGMEGGSFMLTNASGKGYCEATGQLYKYVLNDTTTAIV